MPDRDHLLLDVTFRAGRGGSVLDAQPGITAADLAGFAITPADRERALSELAALGFHLVGPPTDFGATVSGSRELVARVFGEGDLQIPAALERWIAAVRYPPPAEFFRT
ncbi:MAG TPA: hypothetical protein PLS53_03695 [Thermoanaerobaculaceae bacterium]|nr:hypothetical protein [Thermoanaerobaculaceae bacterium]HPS77240.1 hypothetical protein [Thermoanaerobaculaceae bacterium]